MANNTLKGRFRKLYQEVKDNLSEESKNQLINLSKLDIKSLYEYRDNILKILQNEYLIVASDLTKENNISIAEFENRKLCSTWENYQIAIEDLKESIRDYSDGSIEDLEYEQYRAALEESESDGVDWEGLRQAIYGDDEDVDDEDIMSDIDEQEEYSDEESEKDSQVFDLEKVLQQRLTIVVEDIKKRFNITGQTIDFLLELTLDSNKAINFNLS